MQYLMVFITAPNKKEATKISKALLYKRLIACANILKDIDSYFWWKDKREKARECLLIVKTRKSAFKGLVKAVKDIHSYDVPEIVAVPIIAGYKPYLDWLKSET